MCRPTHTPSTQPPVGAQHAAPHVRTMESTHRLIVAFPRNATIHPHGAIDRISCTGAALLRPRPASSNPRLSLPLFYAPNELAHRKNPTHIYS